MSKRLGRSICDRFPYIIEDMASRAVLTDVRELEDGRTVGIYNTGYMKKAYTLDELYTMEDNGLVRIIVRNPSKPCVRVRYDGVRDSWLLETNQPTADSLGWQEEHCFHQEEIARHSRHGSQPYIHANAMMRLIKYARQGFLLVDR